MGLPIKLIVTYKKNEGKTCEDDAIQEALVDAVAELELEVDDGDGEVSLYEIDTVAYEVA